MKDRIKLVEIITPLKDVFPKYTTQLINLANQNCGGTRPKVVGQMSELIVKSKAKNNEQWKKWYLENYPENIDIATKKVWESITKLKNAINLIDQEMVRMWIEDLILNKTAEGLIFQTAILKHLSIKFGLETRCSTPDEEAKGIDGWIGNTPVSIKPSTYDMKTTVKHENIDVEMIIYEKKGNYLILDYTNDIVGKSDK